MFNISFDVDYLNLYRLDRNLPISDEEDPVITKGLERACNLLLKYDFKATFFVVGDSVKEYRSNYLKLINDGNEIGNHTFNHLDLSKLSKHDQGNQIRKCQEIIKSELNYQSVGFKAPGYNCPAEITDILLDAAIIYDTSRFNNILLPFAKIMHFIKIGKSAFGNIKQIYQSAKIHKLNGLYNIPVGTTRFRLPFYGAFHSRYPMLARLGPPDFPFTYLVHPIEFLENHEIRMLKIGFKSKLTDRIKTYKTIFDNLKKSNRRCLLLKNLIKEIDKVST